jgi:hypothetical protein
MTKYCIMRECENIHNGYLYVMTQHLLILKGIYGFKFPKKFLEISSRDLTFFLLLFFFSSSKDLITQSLVPISFPFARLNALQPAVKHSHTVMTYH